MAELPDPTLSRRATGKLLAGAALAAVVAPAFRGLPAAATPNRPGGGTDLDALLAQLTLQEKVDLLHGAPDPASKGQAGYVPGVPRLGIPALRLADGPAGVGSPRRPPPCPRRSRWPPRSPRPRPPVRHGDRAARAAALGQDVLLSPMANLIRVPQAGRNFETFGEDPLLDGDHRRGGDPRHPGRGPDRHRQALRGQQLRERPADGRRRWSTSGRCARSICPAFEAAVEAGAGAVMAAYNRVNGTYAAENPRAAQPRSCAATGASTAG